MNLQTLLDQSLSKSRQFLMVLIASTAACDGNQFQADISKAENSVISKNKMNAKPSLPPKVQYPVDPEFRSAVLEIEEAQITHCSDKHIVYRADCDMEIRDRFEPLGRLRGTPAYVEKHYQPMALTSLLKKRGELRDLLPKLRLLNPPGEEDTAGELTRAQIEMEIASINRLLSDVKKDVLMKECVEAFGQKNAKKMCDHLE